MNLADMSNEQREEHKIRVSKQIGLDPALNLLDYFWIPQENGLSSLVLYAKRGAAEILRDKHDVHVTVLTRQDGPGYVCFTAEGVNKSGRPEIERAGLTAVPIWDIMIFAIPGGVVAVLFQHFCEGAATFRHQ